jgi:hypothetical protein
MKVRKQVYELTLDDFQHAQAWEFALDEEGEEGQDEATVRPLEERPVDATGPMSVVRARFRLADGTNLLGYFYPSPEPDAGLPALQPVIVTPRGQVMFWFGILAPRAEVLADAYANLNKKSDEVFPLTFETDVPLANSVVGGTLNGFAHFRSLSDKTIVEMR